MVGTISSRFQELGTTFAQMILLINWLRGRAIGKKDAFSARRVCVRDLLFCLL